MPFLGHPLSSTLVYIWARRNPDTRLSFLGLLVFTAPYLPWVLMGFSLVLHGTIPKDEIMGVVIGHVWYFFSDVYPPLHNGSRPFDPPMWWRLHLKCIDKGTWVALGWLGIHWSQYGGNMEFWALECFGIHHMRWE
jgi:hypothetical protein